MHHVWTQGPSKCLALKSHRGSSLLSTTPGVRLVGPRLISRNKFRGRPSGLGPRPTPQFWWGSELDSSPMAPPAARDGHTFIICSLGVNNAEEIAGIDADPILPGRSGQFYYDEPAFSERCALVAAIAQGDRAQIVDCRSLRDPAVDPMLHRHMGTHYREHGCQSECPEDPRDRGRHLDWFDRVVYVRNVPGTAYSPCLCLRVCLRTPPKCDVGGLACGVPCPTRVPCHHPAPVRQAMESPLWRPTTMPGMQLQFPVRPVEGILRVLCGPHVEASLVS